jgi:membrane-associated protein
MVTTVTALVTLFLVGLVPVAPTEPLLVSMGVLAATGRLPLAAVILTATVACSAGDHLLYVAGRTVGSKLTTRLLARPRARTAQEWLERRVARWGAPMLVVGRWLPAGGTIGALLAGTLGWRWSRFTPASVIGSALWSAYAALVGYAGGAVTGTPLFGVLVSLGLAVLIGLVSSLVLRRGRRAAGGDLSVPDGGKQSVAAAGALEEEASVAGHLNRACAAA